MFSSSNFRCSKGLFNFAEKLILGLEFFIFIFESVFFSLHYCVDFFILFLSLHSETAVNHNRDTATVDGVLAINNA